MPDIQSLRFTLIISHISQITEICIAARVRPINLSKIYIIKQASGIIIINSLIFLYSLYTTKFWLQPSEPSASIRANRRNSCTQITDGEVDTMITETENPISEKSQSGRYIYKKLTWGLKNCDNISQRYLFVLLLVYYFNKPLLYVFIR